ncbi:MAG: hypothetical protein LBF72_01330 [Holosporales bacterium]|jgi:hypothetical protein|nr:hypothetical protein [Holosporales bacterium]
MARSILRFLKLAQLVLISCCASINGTASTYTVQDLLDKLGTNVDVGKANNPSSSSTLSQDILTNTCWLYKNNNAAQPTIIIRDDDNARGGAFNAIRDNEFTFSAYGKCKKLWNVLNSIGQSLGYTFSDTVFNTINAYFDGLLSYGSKTLVLGTLASTDGTYLGGFNSALATLRSSIASLEICSGDGSSGSALTLGGRNDPSADSICHRLNVLYRTTHPEATTHPISKILHDIAESSSYGLDLILKLWTTTTDPITAGDDGVTLEAKLSKALSDNLLKNVLTTAFYNDGSTYPPVGSFSDQLAFLWSTNSLQRFDDFQKIIVGEGFSASMQSLIMELKSAIEAIPDRYGGKPLELSQLETLYGYLFPANPVSDAIGSISTGTDSSGFTNAATYNIGNDATLQECFLALASGTLDSNSTSAIKEKTATILNNLVTAIKDFEPLNKYADCYKELYLFNGYLEEILEENEDFTEWLSSANCETLDFTIEIQISSITANSSMPLKDIVGAINSALGDSLGPISYTTPTGEITFASILAITEKISRNVERVANFGPLSENIASEYDDLEDVLTDAITLVEKIISNLGKEEMIGDEEKNYIDEWEGYFASIKESIEQLLSRIHLVEILKYLEPLAVDIQDYGESWITSQVGDQNAQNLYAEEKMTKILGVIAAIGYEADAATSTTISSADVTAMLAAICTSLGITPNTALLTFPYSTSNQIHSRFNDSMNSLINKLQDIQKRIKSDGEMEKYAVFQKEGLEECFDEISANTDLLATGEAAIGNIPTILHYIFSLLYKWSKAKALATSSGLCANKLNKLNEGVSSFVNKYKGEMEKCRDFPFNDIDITVDEDEIASTGDLNQQYLKMPLEDLIEIFVEKILKNIKLFTKSIYDFGMDLNFRIPELCQILLTTGVELKNFDKKLVDVLIMGDNSVYRKLIGHLNNDQKNSIFKLLSEISQTLPSGLTTSGRYPPYRNLVNHLPHPSLASAYDFVHDRGIKSGNEMEKQARANAFVRGATAVRSYIMDGMQQSDSLTDFNSKYSALKEVMDILESTEISQAYNDIADQKNDEIMFAVQEFDDIMLVAENMYAGLVKNLIDKVKQNAQESTIEDIRSKAQEYGAKNLFNTAHLWEDLEAFAEEAINSHRLCSTCAESKASLWKVYERISTDDVVEQIKAGINAPIGEDGFDLSGVLSGMAETLSLPADYATDLTWPPAPYSNLSFADLAELIIVKSVKQYMNDVAEAIRYLAFNATAPPTLWWKKLFNGYTSENDKATIEDIISAFKAEFDYLFDETHEQYSFFTLLLDEAAQGIYKELDNLEKACAEQQEQQQKERQIAFLADVYERIASTMPLRSLDCFDTTHKYVLEVIAQTKFPTSLEEPTETTSPEQHPIFPEVKEAYKRITSLYKAEGQNFITRIKEKLATAEASTHATGCCSSLSLEDMEELIREIFGITEQTSSFSENYDSFEASDGPSFIEQVRQAAYIYREQDLFDTAVFWNDLCEFADNMLKTCQICELCTALKDKLRKLHNGILAIVSQKIGLFKTSRDVPLKTGEGFLDVNDELQKIANAIYAQLQNDATTAGTELQKLPENTESPEQLAEVVTVRLAKYMQDLMESIYFLALSPATPPPSLYIKALDLPDAAYNVTGNDFSLPATQLHTDEMYESLMEVFPAMHDKYSFFPELLKALTEEIDRAISSLQKRLGEIYEETIAQSKIQRALPIFEFIEKCRSRLQVINEPIDYTKLLNLFGWWYRRIKGKITALALPKTEHILAEVQDAYRSLVQELIVILSKSTEVEQIIQDSYKYIKDDFFGTGVFWQQILQNALEQEHKYDDGFISGVYKVALVLFHADQHCANIIAGRPAVGDLSSVKGKIVDIQSDFSNMNSTDVVTAACNVGKELGVTDDEVEYCTKTVAKLDKDKHNDDRFYYALLTRIRNLLGQIAERIIAARDVRDVKADNLSLANISALEAIGGQLLDLSNLTGLENNSKISEGEYALVRDDVKQALYEVGKQLLHVRDIAVAGSGDQTRSNTLKRLSRLISKICKDTSAENNPYCGGESTYVNKILKTNEILRNYVDSAGDDYVDSESGSTIGELEELWEVDGNVPPQAEILPHEERGNVEALVIDALGELLDTLEEFALKAEELALNPEETNYVHKNVSVRPSFMEIIEFLQKIADQSGATVLDQNAINLLDDIARVVTRIFQISANCRDKSVENFFDNVLTPMYTILQNLSAIESAAQEAYENRGMRATQPSPTPELGPIAAVLNSPTSLLDKITVIAERFGATTPMPYPTPRELFWKGDEKNCASADEAAEIYLTRYKTLLEDIVRKLNNIAGVFEKDYNATIDMRYKRGILLLAEDMLKQFSPIQLSQESLPSPTPLTTLFEAMYYDMRRPLSSCPEDCYQLFPSNWSSDSQIGKNKEYADIAEDFRAAVQNIADSLHGKIEERDATETRAAAKILAEMYAFLSGVQEQDLSALVNESSTWPLTQQETIRIELEKILGALQITEDQQHADKNLATLLDIVVTKLKDEIFPELKQIFAGENANIAPEQFIESMQYDITQLLVDSEIAQDFLRGIDSLIAKYLVYFKKTAHPANINAAQIFIRIQEILAATVPLLKAGHDPYVGYFMKEIDLVHRENVAAIEAIGQRLSELISELSLDTRQYVPDSAQLLFRIERNISKASIYLQKIVDLSANTDKINSLLGNIKSIESVLSEIKGIFSNPLESCLTNLDTKTGNILNTLGTIYGALATPPIGGFTTDQAAEEKSACLKISSQLVPELAIISVSNRVNEIMQSVREACDILSHCVPDYEEEVEEVLENIIFDFLDIRENIMPFFSAQTQTLGASAEDTQYVYHQEYSLEDLTNALNTSSLEKLAQTYAISRHKKRCTRAHSVVVTLEKLEKTLEACCGSIKPYVLTSGSDTGEISLGTINTILTAALQFIEKATACAINFANIDTNQDALDQLLQHVDGIADKICAQLGITLPPLQTMPLIISEKQYAAYEMEFLNSIERCSKIIKIFYKEFFAKYFTLSPLVFEVGYKMQDFAEHIVSLLRDRDAAFSNTTAFAPPNYSASSAAINSLEELVSEADTFYQNKGISDHGERITEGLYAIATSLEDCMKGLPVVGDDTGLYSNKQGELKDIINGLINTINTDLKGAIDALSSAEAVPAEADQWLLISRSEDVQTLLANVASVIDRCVGGGTQYTQSEKKTTAFTSKLDSHRKSSSHKMASVYLTKIVRCTQKLDEYFSEIAVLSKIDQDRHQIYSPALISSLENLKSAIGVICAEIVKLADNNQGAISRAAQQDMIYILGNIEKNLTSSIDKVETIKENIEDRFWNELCASFNSFVNVLQSKNYTLSQIQDFIEGVTKNDYPESLGDLHYDTENLNALVTKIKDDIEHELSGLSKINKKVSEYDNDTLYDQYSTYFAGAKELSNWKSEAQSFIKPEENGALKPDSLAGEWDEDKKLVQSSAQYGINGLQVLYNDFAETIVKLSETIKAIREAAEQTESFILKKGKDQYMNTLIEAIKNSLRALSESVNNLFATQFTPFFDFINSTARKRGKSELTKFQLVDNDYTFANFLRSQSSEMYIEIQQICGLFDGANCCFMTALTNIELASKLNQLANVMRYLKTTPWPNKDINSILYSVISRLSQGEISGISKLWEDFKSCYTGTTGDSRTDSGPYCSSNELMTAIKKITNIITDIISSIDGASISPGHYESTTMEAEKNKYLMSLIHEHDVEADKVSENVVIYCRLLPSINDCILKAIGNILTEMRDLAHFVIGNGLKSYVEENCSNSASEIIEMLQNVAQNDFFEWEGPAGLFCSQCQENWEDEYDEMFFESETYTSFQTFFENAFSEVRELYRAFAHMMSAAKSFHCTKADISALRKILSGVTAISEALDIFKDVNDVSKVNIIKEEDDLSKLMLCIKALEEPLAQMAKHAQYDDETLHLAEIADILEEYGFVKSVSQDWLPHDKYTFANYVQEIQARVRIILDITRYNNFKLEENLNDLNHVFYSQNNLSLIQEIFYSLQNIAATFEDFQWNEQMSAFSQGAAGHVTTNFRESFLGLSESFLTMFEILSRTGQSQTIGTIAQLNNVETSIREITSAINNENCINFLSRDIDFAENTDPYETTLSDLAEKLDGIKTDEIKNFYEQSTPNYGLLTTTLSNDLIPHISACGESMSSLPGTISQTGLSSPIDNADVLLNRINQHLANQAAAIDKVAKIIKETDAFNFHQEIIDAGLKVFNSVESLYARISTLVAAVEESSIHSAQESSFFVADLVESVHVLSTSIANIINTVQEKEMSREAEFANKVAARLEYLADILDGALLSNVPLATAKVLAAKLVPCLQKSLYVCQSADNPRPTSMHSKEMSEWRGNYLAELDSIVQVVRAHVGGSSQYQYFDIATPLDGPQVEAAEHRAETVINRISDSLRELTGIWAAIPRRFEAAFVACCQEIIELLGHNTGDLSAMQAAIEDLVNSLKNPTCCEEIAEKMEEISHNIRSRQYILEQMMKQSFVAPNAFDASLVAVWKQMQSAIDDVIDKMNRNLTYGYLDNLGANLTYSCLDGNYAALLDSCITLLGNIKTFAGQFFNCINEPSGTRAVSGNGFTGCVSREILAYRIANSLQETINACDLVAVKTRPKINEEAPFYPHLVWVIAELCEKVTPLTRDFCLLAVPEREEDCQSCSNFIHTQVQHSLQHSIAGILGKLHEINTILEEAQYSAFSAAAHKIFKNTVYLHHFLENIHSINVEQANMENIKQALLRSGAAWQTFMWGEKTRENLLLFMREMEQNLSAIISTLPTCDAALAEIAQIPDTVHCLQSVEQNTLALINLIVKGRTPQEIVDRAIDAMEQPQRTPAQNKATGALLECVSDYYSLLIVQDISSLQDLNQAQRQFIQALIPSAEFNKAIQQVGKIYAHHDECERYIELATNALQSYADARYNISSIASTAPLPFPNAGDISKVIEEIENITECIKKIELYSEQMSVQLRSSPYSVCFTEVDEGHYLLDAVEKIAENMADIETATANIAALLNATTGEYQDLESLHEQIDDATNFIARDDIFNVWKKLQDCLNVNGETFRQTLATLKVLAPSSPLKNDYHHGKTRAFADTVSEIYNALFEDMHFSSLALEAYDQKIINQISSSLKQTADLVPQLNGLWKMMFRNAIINSSMHCLERIAHEVEKIKGYTESSADEDRDVLFLNSEMTRRSISHIIETLGDYASNVTEVGEFYTEEEDFQHVAAQLPSVGATKIQLTDSSLALQTALDTFSSAIASWEALLASEDGTNWNERCYDDRVISALQDISGATKEIANNLGFLTWFLPGNSPSSISAYFNFLSSNIDGAIIPLLADPTCCVRWNDVLYSIFSATEFLSNLTKDVTNVVNASLPLFDNLVSVESQNDYEQYEQAVLSGREMVTQLLQKIAQDLNALSAAVDNVTPLPDQHCNVGNVATQLKECEDCFSEMAATAAEALLLVGNKSTAHEQTVLADLPQCKKTTMLLQKICSELDDMINYFTKFDDYAERSDLYEYDLALNNALETVLFALVRSVDSLEKFASEKVNEICRNCNDGLTRGEEHEIERDEILREMGQSIIDLERSIFKITQQINGRKTKKQTKIFHSIVNNIELFANVTRDFLEVKVAHEEVGAIQLFTNFIKHTQALYDQIHGILGNMPEAGEADDEYLRQMIALNEVLTAWNNQLISDLSTMTGLEEQANRKKDEPSIRYTPEVRQIDSARLLDIIQGLISAFVEAKGSEQYIHLNCSNAWMENLLSLANVVDLMQTRQNSAFAVHLYHATSELLSRETDFISFLEETPKYSALQKELFQIDGAIRSISHEISNRKQDFINNLTDTYLDFLRGMYELSSLINKATSEGFGQDAILAASATYTLTENIPSFTEQPDLQNLSPIINGIFQNNIGLLNAFSQGTVLPQPTAPPLPKFVNSTEALLQRINQSTRAFADLLKEIPEISANCPVRDVHKETFKAINSLAETITNYATTMSRPSELNERVHESFEIEYIKDDVERNLLAAAENILAEKEILKDACCSRTAFSIFEIGERIHLLSKSIANYGGITELFSGESQNNKSLVVTSQKIVDKIKENKLNEIDKVFAEIMAHAPDTDEDIPSHRKNCEQETRSTGEELYSSTAPDETDRRTHKLSRAWYTCECRAAGMNHWLGAWIECLDMLNDVFAAQAEGTEPQTILLAPQSPQLFRCNTMPFVIWQTINQICILNDVFLPKVKAIENCKIIYEDVRPIYSLMSLIIEAILSLRKLTLEQGFPREEESTPKGNDSKPKEEGNFPIDPDGSTNQQTSEELAPAEETKTPQEESPNPFCRRCTSYVAENLELLAFLNSVLDSTCEELKRVQKVLHEYCYFGSVREIAKYNNNIAFLAQIFNVLSKYTLENWNLLQILPFDDILGLYGAPLYTSQDGDGAVFTNTLEKIENLPGILKQWKEQQSEPMFVTSAPIDIDEFCKMDDFEKYVIELNTKLSSAINILVSTITDEEIVVPAQRQFALPQKADISEELAVKTLKETITSHGYLAEELRAFFAEVYANQLTSSQKVLNKIFTLSRLFNQISKHFIEIYAKMRDDFFCNKFDFEADFAPNVLCLSGHYLDLADIFWEARERIAKDCCASSFKIISEIQKSIYIFSSFLGNLLQKESLTSNGTDLIIEISDILAAVLKNDALQRQLSKIKQQQTSALAIKRVCRMHGLNGAFSELLDTVNEAVYDMQSLCQRNSISVIQNPELDDDSYSCADFEKILIKISQRIDELTEMLSSAPFSFGYEPLSSNYAINNLENVYNSCLVVHDLILAIRMDDATDAETIRKKHLCPVCSQSGINSGLAMIAESFTGLGGVILNMKEQIKSKVCCQEMLIQFEQTAHIIQTLNENLAIASAAIANSGAIYLDSDFVEPAKFAEEMSLAVSEAQKDIRSLISTRATLLEASEENVCFSSALTKKISRLNETLRGPLFAAAAKFMEHLGIAPLTPSAKLMPYTERSPADIMRSIGTALNGIADSVSQLTCNAVEQRLSTRSTLASLEEHVASNPSVFLTRTICHTASLVSQLNEISADIWALAYESKAKPICLSRTADDPESVEEANLAVERVAESLHALLSALLRQKNVDRVIAINRIFVLFKLFATLTEGLTCLPFQSVGSTENLQTFGDWGDVAELGRLFQTWAMQFSVISESLRDIQSAAVNFVGIEAIEEALRALCVATNNFQKEHISNFDIPIGLISEPIDMQNIQIETFLQGNSILAENLAYLKDGATFHGLLAKNTLQPPINQACVSLEEIYFGIQRLLGALAADEPTTVDLSGVGIRDIPAFSAELEESNSKVIGSFEPLAGSFFSPQYVNKLEKIGEIAKYIHAYSEFFRNVEREWESAEAEYEGGKNSFSREEYDRAFAAFLLSIRELEKTAEQIKDAVSQAETFEEATDIICAMLCDFAVQNLPIAAEQDYSEPIENEMLPQSRNSKTIPLAINNVVELIGGLLASIIKFLKTEQSMQNKWFLNVVDEGGKNADVRDPYENGDIPLSINNTLQFCQEIIHLLRKKADFEAKEQQNDFVLPYIKPESSNKQVSTNQQTFCDSVYGALDTFSYAVNYLIDFLYVSKKEAKANSVLNKAKNISFYDGKNVIDMLYKTQYNDLGFPVMDEKNRFITQIGTFLQESKAVSNFAIKLKNALFATPLRG